MKPSKRLQEIPEYIHARLNKEVKKVEENTKRKVLNFGQGSPDVRPSPKYINKLHEFIDLPNSHLYPGYSAIPEFALALQGWYKTRFGVSIEKDQLLPLLGEKDGISHFPMAFLDPGDELLVPNPGYPPFYEPTLLADAIPVPYDLLEKDNFKINLDEIAKKITHKTKAIWVNFPSNPTGQVATLVELEKLVNFTKEKNIFVLYDNAYSEITFDNFFAPSILQIKGAEDIALEFCSFSKSYSFAGFRMGWVAGNKDAVAALSKAKTQMDTGMSLPLQQLAAFALSNQDKEWTNLMLESYSKRRDVVASFLPSLGLKFSIPKSALYFWAKIPDSETNAETFCMKLLEEKQILFTPGNAFGTNGYRFVRISYCINIDNIKEYFK